MQNAKSNTSWLFTKLIYPLAHMFRILYGDVQKIPKGKNAYKMIVWLEVSLKLAILKYPNLELKQSIENYLDDRQDDLLLTNREFIQHVDAVLGHATFKGKAWINKEYEKSRDIKAAKDLLKYGPSDKIKPYLKEQIKSIKDGFLKHGVLEYTI